MYARQVWKGVHLDRRLTPVNGEENQSAGVTEYLWHGLGFGGSCFPKDVAACVVWLLSRADANLDAVFYAN